MRTENISVKLTIPIPFNKPDKNGVVHTEEAVINALNHFQKNIPILYRGTEAEDEKLIGITTGNSIITTWDFDDQVCKVTVDGMIYHGGADIIINEMDGNEITSFEVRSVGISL